MEDVFASYVDEAELAGDENSPVLPVPQVLFDRGTELLSLRVDLAPAITPILGMGAFARADSREVSFNPKVGTLYAPVQGPAALPPGVRRESVNNTPTGHVERTNLNTFLFDQQYHTFHSYGFASDPTVNASASAFVGSFDRCAAKSATTVFDPSHSARLLRKQAKQRRAQGGDPGTETYLGPWAPPTDEKTPTQLTVEEVAAYEAWKPISKKKRKQMERQAMLAEQGEGDEDEDEAPEQPKKEKKKKKKKSIETVFDEEDNDAMRRARGYDADGEEVTLPTAVGPRRPPKEQQSGAPDGGDDGDDAEE